MSDTAQESADMEHEREYAVRWSFTASGTTYVYDTTEDLAYSSIQNRTLSELLMDAEWDEVEIEWIDEL